MLIAFNDEETISRICYVAWIRDRDQHILTVNNTTFISDARFGPIHMPQLASWALRIKYVDTNDAGFYECQISTTPKKSRSIELKIVVLRGV
ncbi:unnamed protein product [Notodromas monacha]|uniref:Ig-like domain-containing protein n=1 Tax=Notodromas monacha TaxID=399045 RepID=A0A7R9BPM4_9CRUS|nr:unnamed protein product [Notodromas monacha]CAG0918272.1 unnamed protein product [Notodromas monacha]